MQWLDLKTPQEHVLNQLKAGLNRIQTFFLWLERLESNVPGCLRTVTGHYVLLETFHQSDWILKLHTSMHWILLECCMVIPHRGGRGHQPPCQPPCNQSCWVRVLDPILRWLWGSMRLMSPVSLTGMIFLWSSMIGSENWTRAYIESCWSAAWSSPTEEAGGINLVVNLKQEQHTTEGEKRRPLFHWEYG